LDRQILGESNTLDRLVRTNQSFKVKMYHLQAKLEQMKGVPRTRKRSHDVSASEEELEIDL
jgi:hypothetical protein